ncbi:discoidin domain-containing protein, partial [Tamlana agarivorans]
MIKNVKGNLIIIALIIFGFQSVAQNIGPWNTNELFQTPSYRTTNVSAVSGLTGLLYESIDYLNNPTEVFAYYSAPSGTMPSGGWPAVVFVHGASGTARADWVQYWNDRGYAAISMDTEGRYPTGAETPNSGPHQVGVWQDYYKDIDEQWFYHAVALVSRANSLLRSFPEVNANKIGVMGISWGGTITSTVMGVDNRFRWATPIYGAGFLSGSDGHQGNEMSAAEQEVVDTYFAAQLYFDNVTYPTMWINGTNDKHFPMTCTQQSSRAVNGSATLRYSLRLAHNHTAPQALNEVYYFAEQVINGASPMPVMGTPNINANQVSVTFSSSVGVKSAQLLYTTDDGIWNERAWQASAATISANTITANIPNNATTVYLTATDNRDLMVSSEYILTSEESTTTPTGGNLALNGTATQSSTANGGLASRAIDGNTNGAWNGGSVAHTLAEDNAWWDLQLGAESTIEDIVIYNRTDACCSDRLTDFTVLIWNADGTRTYRKLNNSTTGASVTINVGGVLGSRIRIKSNLAATQLNLAEVEVYGNSNLALNGTATQSSTANGGLASRAIDGNTNGAWSAGSVTHTSAEDGAWWALDLGADYNIGEIKIYNRTDACCTERLSSFTMFMWDSNGNRTIRKVINTTPDPYITIDAGGVLGKSIRINSNLTGTALSLAEVEVYNTSSSSTA